MRASLTILAPQSLEFLSSFGPETTIKSCYNTTLPATSKYAQSADDLHYLDTDSAHFVHTGRDVPGIRVQPHGRPEGRRRDAETSRGRSSWSKVSHGQARHLISGSSRRTADTLFGTVVASQWLDSRYWMVVLTDGRLRMQRISSRSVRLNLGFRTPLTATRSP